MDSVLPPSTANFVTPLESQSCDPSVVVMAESSVMVNVGENRSRPPPDMAIVPPFILTLR